MSWNDEKLFATSELLAREGELLEGLPFVNRHEVAKHIIEQRIVKKFSHIDDPLSQIVDPKIFSEAAICLNIALVLRENSSRKDDIFSIRAEFYQRRFEEELMRVFSILRLTSASAGVEILR